MRPTKVSKTNAGTSAWLPVDYNVSPFNLGFGAVIGGTPTYDIEYTYDNVQDPTVTPTAFKLSGGTGKTANFDGQIAQPVTAVRINITAAPGGAGDSVTLTAIQGNGL